MSFPNPTAAPHSYPYISPPYSGETPFWMGNDHQQQQQHFDMMPQFDKSHPLKKARTSERAPAFNPRMNPAASNMGTSHIFYKTRICAKFKEGTCRNGEHCSFAHGDEDLREPPPNWQELIREREREERGGNWVDDQRMIHRMKICKKYYNGEECPYGEKCNFLHQRPPMKKLMHVNDIPGQRERESSAISIGTTPGGGDFEHTPFWKTRLCGKWEMGHCPFAAERCHYAHGQSELRFSGSPHGQSELRFSGSPDEAELVLHSTSAPRKTASVSAFIAPPVAAAPIIGNGEEKAKSKWKLTKKVNRIYADWLDDLSPPRSMPDKEDI